jgi:hypothetical protein
MTTKPRKGGGELYYVDENGERQAAELHLLPSLTTLTFLFRRSTLIQISAHSSPRLASSNNSTAFAG